MNSLNPGSLFEQWHIPTLHPEFIGGSCSCGQGPFCPGCGLCLSCGRMDFGLPFDMSRWALIGRRFSVGGYLAFLSTN